MSTSGRELPPRPRPAATRLGAAVVVLVSAGGLALSAGDDADPDRCRGVTRSQAPPLVTIAGARGCVDAAELAAEGTVRYGTTGQCFVLDPARSAGSALLVWPDRSRPVAARGQAVLVRDRSVGAQRDGGRAAVRDTIKGVRPVLGPGAVDRVSGGCRAAVAERVVAYERLRVRPPG